MGLVLKQNYTNEKNMLCLACKHYGILSFSPGMDELQTCDIYGDIPPDMLTGAKSDCGQFETKDD